MSNFAVGASDEVGVGNWRRLSAITVVSAESAAEAALCGAPNVLDDDNFPDDETSAPADVDVWLIPDGVALQDLPDNEPPVGAVFRGRFPLYIRRQIIFEHRNIPPKPQMQTSTSTPPRARTGDTNAKR